MRIVKNTTRYETKRLRSLICRVHAHMKKLEGRPAPNWKGLRVVIRNHAHKYKGYAYYGGNSDHHWDVHLSLPPWADERGTAWLVYHELMHTYGYNHSQYSNIPKSELEALFPDNEKLGPWPIPKEAKPEPEWGRLPIIIKLGRKALDELVSAEYGSWEDYENAGQPDDEHPHGHTVEIAGRHKTQLELRTLGEAEEVRWAASSGTWSLYCPTVCWRVIDELDKHIKAIKEAQATHHDRG